MEKKNKYQIGHIILIFLCFAFLFSCKNKAIVKDFIEKIMEAPENIEAICETSEINTDKFQENYLKEGTYYRRILPIIKDYFKEGYDIIENNTVSIYLYEENKSKYGHWMKIQSKEDGWTLEFKFDYDEAKDKLYFYAITTGNVNSSDVIIKE